jgi:hypothetical protein
VKRAAALFAAVLVLAGCGSSGTPTSDRTPPTTTAVPPVTTSTAAATTTNEAAPTTLELFYLASDGRLVAASRTVEHTTMPGTAALHELTLAPDGMTTQVPDGLTLTIADGKATVSGATLNQAAEAQVVYTLTSFPTVQTVDGKTRQNVEAFAPAILVEHPVAGESVRSPLHVTGTADTFEATFQYTLSDASGKQLAHDTVTATSGSGERGTFEFDAPFSVDTAQHGTLAVFEMSAENGSVIHERDIPLQLLP